MSVMSIAKGSELQVHRPALEKAIMSIVKDGTMDKLRTTHLSGFKMPDSKTTTDKPAE